MKRWVWCLVALASVAAISGNPAIGTDVGRLQPVQTVQLSCDQGTIQIQTDTGASGVGDTLEHALQTMQATAPAEVFLDTAEYLLVAPTCAPLLPALMDTLRPSCLLCWGSGAIDLTQAGKFLSVHDPGITLMHYMAGDLNVPTLQQEKGRMRLVW